MPPIPEKVDAQPTKEFFVHMLVKDIDLVAAICDLIDNSADAARDLRGDGTYEGLRVAISLSDTEFRIDDNCGGMSLQDAKSYVFRFGRVDDPEVEPPDHGIGVFGVGMKRALFKLGERFVVRSDDGADAFEVRVNVSRWLNDPIWAFPLRRIAHLSDPGTSIRVTALYEAIAEDFASERFRSNLALEIGRRHQAFLGRGLRISLNRHALKGRPPTLRETQSMRSAFVRQSLNGTGPPLQTRVYCGLDERSPRDAGWYVFCNDRLVLGPDKTDQTGWGARRGLPRFHNQYANFRGYVFFDSSDPTRLPWTTTKMDLDLGAPAYRAARNTMFTVMQPVIRFLNDVKGSAQEDALAKDMAGAEVLTLDEIPENPTFQGPALPTAAPAPDVKRIQYSKPTALVERVKRSLGVTTLTAVGEETFDYYYVAECDTE